MCGLSGYTLLWAKVSKCVGRGLSGYRLRLSGLKCLNVWRLSGLDSLDFAVGQNGNRNRLKCGA